MDPEGFGFGAFMAAEENAELRKKLRRKNNKSNPSMTSGVMTMVFQLLPSTFLSRTSKQGMMGLCFWVGLSLG